MTERKRKRRIPVNLPDEIVELLDQLVQNGHFRSRHQAMVYFITRGAVEYASKVYR